MLLSRARGKSSAQGIGYRRCWRKAIDRVVALGGIASNGCGDNLDFEGRPRGRPLLLISGDVNQGGEMQVLSRELDALNPSELTVDGVGHDSGTGHPECVPGIV